MQFSDSRMIPKIDCGLFQMRGVESKGCVFHVCFATMERGSKTPPSVAAKRTRDTSLADATPLFWKSQQFS